MAAELGQFPEFAKNADDMLRVLNQHGDMVANCSHHSSTTDLVEIIESTWLEALEIGSQEGFRNAQVSVLCDAPDLTTLIGCDAFGVSPNDGLLTDKKTPAGYYEKGVSSFVAQGLNKLGYSETQIADIVRHIAGHGTLEDAPGVNHETLRKRGFTAAAIDAVENALSCSNDITLAFNPFVLGEDYCRHMLGFTVAEFNDDNFDMLAGLGFSDAGIEAATIYCCGAGTMEGAPHLAPEHLAIFDCLVQQGVRGQRCVTTTSIVKMMAALTPHISGAIGQTLQVPAEISLGDYRTILELAHRLKLKSITLRRIPADLELSSQPEAENQPVPAFAVIQGGQSIPQLNEYISEEAETRIPLSAITRSDVSDDMEISPDVAKASRRALSHAARSSASVSSSADALVEQRHV
jgi:ribonucleoside-diphosphate reductase alpha chain